MPHLPLCGPTYVGLCLNIAVRSFFSCCSMPKRKPTTQARPHRKRTPSWKARREETQLESSSDDEEATPNPTSVLEQLSATNQRLERISQLLQDHIQGGSCDKPQLDNQPSTSAQATYQSAMAAAQSDNHSSSSA